jgi:hypothetical protein
VQQLVAPNKNQKSQQAVDQLENQKSQQVASQLENTFSQQLITQIPWGHNIAIITKCKSVSEYIITKKLPKELKSTLPTIKEIKAELKE